MSGELKLLYAILIVFIINNQLIDASLLFPRSVIPALLSSITLPGLPSGLPSVSTTTTSKTIDHDDQKSKFPVIKSIINSISEIIGQVNLSGLITSSAVNNIRNPDVANQMISVPEMQEILAKIKSFQKKSVDDFKEAGWKLVHQETTFSLYKRRYPYIYLSGLLL